MAEALTAATKRLENLVEDCVGPLNKPAQTIGCQNETRNRKVPSPPLSSLSFLDFTSGRGKIPSTVTMGNICINATQECHVSAM
jgi:hypothetical protein